MSDAIVQAKTKEEIMKKWKARYSSMSATYDCGTYYAETKEEAEREARRNATAFDASEKRLINCVEVKS